jgi:ATP-binding cassette, subfamily B, bacterial
MKTKTSFFRFFDAFTYVPKEHIKTWLHWAWLWLFTIITLEIFEKIFKSIEALNTELTFKIIWFYLFMSLFIFIIRLTPLAYRNGWANIIFFWLRELYKEYLEKYVQADGNTVEKIGTGKFISILEKWAGAWFDTSFKLTYFWVQYSIVIVYSIIKITQLNITAWLISILFLILGWIGSTFANFKMKKVRRFRYEAQNEVSRWLVRVLMSKNELLQNNQLHKEVSSLSISLEKAVTSQWKVAFWYNVLEEIPRFLFAILRIGVYIYLLFWIIQKEATLAELSIFITIMVMMDKSINEFLQFTREFLKDIGLVEKLWETFDNLPSIKWYDTGNIFKPQKKNIEIKDITYTYEEIPVFEKFSLTIEQGKKTALVWLSGAGKTTLMKLIAWYIHPQSGSIEVMWNKLDKTALKTYYPHIWYLTQEPWVFDATIRENLIASAGNNITKSDLENALKNAKCEFIFEFKEGLDTEIWERGIRLSGWQKQRLAIAKIFLKNPEIILLDEPTSALDSFSEEAVTEALNELFKGRTVIVVAHRLQTVKKADDIIVLENGKIIERWKHSELVKIKGKYNKMLELQSGF